MSKLKIKVKKETALTKKEKDLIDLSLGKKKAETEHEKKLLKQIKEIKQKGSILYIPHD